MKTCSVKECSRSANWRDDGKRGFCSMHYRRWQRHKDPLMVKYADDGAGCISKGYRVLTISGNTIYEHVHIMEQSIGRKLKPFPTEIVHHVNHNKLDNRLENLIIVDQPTHAKLHAKTRYSYLDTKCEQCGSEFRTSSWQIKRNAHCFCSRACASIARRKGGVNHITKYKNIH